MCAKILSKVRFTCGRTASNTSFSSLFVSVSLWNQRFCFWCFFFSFWCYVCWCTEYIDGIKGKEKNNKYILLLLDVSDIMVCFFFFCFSIFTSNLKAWQWTWMLARTMAAHSIYCKIKRKIKFSFERTSSIRVSGKRARERISSAIRMRTKWMSARDAKLWTFIDSCILNSIPVLLSSLIDCGIVWASDFDSIQ